MRLQVSHDALPIFVRDLKGGGCFDTDICVGNWSWGGVRTFQV